MSLRRSVTDRAVDLPPAYRLVTLRESGDAFAHACRIAADQGAGTVVWVRRVDVAEFAVVLEPDEPLATARRAVYAGMAALAQALAAHAPPEMPIAFDWPDAVRVDGVLVGGARLGWPSEGPEEAIPPWLVFSATIRTIVIRAGDPGLRPLLGALDELGFEGLDAAELIASFARHLMAEFHTWSEDGFDAVAARWLKQLPRRGGEAASLAGNGDLILLQGGQQSARRSLRDALAAPSWQDPATGMPWL